VARRRLALAGLAIVTGCLPAAPAHAARLISPVGGQQVLGEQSLLDDIEPLQALPANVRVPVPFHFELDPGEAQPTGIEVIGVAAGGRTPTPDPGRANRLSGLTILSMTAEDFDGDGDPFWVYRCSPAMLSLSEVASCQQQVSVPVAAGTYYWHVRASQAGCFGHPQSCLLPWTSQVERFTIPAVFRLNGLQVPRRTRSCVTGAVIRYDTNQPSPVLTYGISVAAARSGRRVLRLSGATGGKRTRKVEVKNGEYQDVVRVPLNAVRAGRYRARLRVNDAAGNRAAAVSRTFTVPNPSATCRLPRVRG
jgi:hypothetical protein